MFKKLSSLLLLALPVVSFAQEVFKGTNDILGGIYGTVRALLIPLVFTLALLFFFYGVAKYIWQEGSNKEDGRRIMIWGVIALFVMSSIWGIVYFIQGELGINGTRNMNVPTINGTGSGGNNGGGVFGGCAGEPGTPDCP